MFITRQQYDALVTNYPKWMSQQWRKLFKCQWSISGIQVSGSPEAIGELQRKLG